MKTSLRPILPALLILLVFLGGCSSTPEPLTEIAPTATATASSTPLPATPTKQPYVSPTPKPVLPPIRTPQLREALPAEGRVEFHILHWNDFHGELGEYVNDEGNWIPGAARLAAFVKAEEAKYDPNQVLLLDAGDWFEGSKYALPSRGLKVADLYQQLGVDAVTVGNHEFFLGLSQFYAVASRAAPVEFVSVNLKKKGSNKICSDKFLVNPYKIFELGEAAGPKVRVAVIGAGAVHLERQSYTPITDVCYIDPLGETIKLYDQLLATEQPDVFILLTHQGFDADKAMAETLNAAGKPVDIIIGGHSHTWIEKPERVGNTLIVTAGERGRAVGVLDLVYDRARSDLDVTWRQEIFSACSPEDPDTVAFLQDTVPASDPRQECTSMKNPDHAYLIDIPTTVESVGYWTLGKGVYPASDSGMLTGQSITSHDKGYPYGLFAHAPSKLRYALDGKYSTFVTEISVKETACGDGASFLVSLDGKEIYRSEQISPGAAAIPLSLDITDGKVLTLQTLSGNDNSCDWTIWGDPYLVRK
jgi:5'-nucleotidase